MRRRNNGDTRDGSDRLVAELPIFIAKGERKRCFTVPCSLRRLKEDVPVGRLCLSLASWSQALV
jgi:hypothetical protein